LSGITKSGETEKIVATILNIYHEVPAAGSKFVETLCGLVLHTERLLLVGPSSPFRLPLFNFLLRYPHHTISLFLTDANIKVIYHYIFSILRELLSFLNYYPN
jgi:transformation/transcription domain-associated protein